MDFDYIGSGVIQTFGCAPIEINKFYLSLFGVGTVVYDRISASKGYLEEVAIKDIRFTHGRYGQQINIYKSTYHWLYNEYDLCTQAEAVALVTAFYQGQVDMLNDALAELNC